MILYCSFYNNIVLQEEPGDPECKQQHCQNNPTQDRQETRSSRKFQIKIIQKTVFTLSYLEKREIER